MGFFLQNYYYIAFFCGWAFLFFSLTCFLSWRSKLGKLAYFWMFMFGLLSSLVNFLEMFFFGNFLFHTQILYVNAFLNYAALLCFFMSAKVTFGKFNKSRAVKYLIIPCSVIPLAGLFFGINNFANLSFMFLWIPASLIIAYSIYKISVQTEYERKSIFYILLLFICYTTVYTVSEIVKFSGKDIILLQFLCKVALVTIVFIIASLIFTYFKVALEKKGKIYEYIPLYWRHIPIGSILFVVLVAGMFFSMYLENSYKNGIIKNSQTVVSSISETISARLSKSDQISAALSRSPYIKEALSFPLTANRTVVDAMFASYASSFNVYIIFALNNEGSVVFSSDSSQKDFLSGINFQNRQYFTEAKGKGLSKTFTKSFFDENEGYYSSSRIDHVKRGYAGVLVVRDDMEDIAAKLKQYSNIYVVDKNGIVFMSDKDSVYFSSLWPIYDTHAAVKKDMLGSEVFDGDTISINNEYFYVSRKSINDEGWSVVYFSSLNSLKQFKVLSVCVVSGALIIIILLFWTINQSNRIFALALQHKAILSSAKSVAIISTDTSGRIIVYGQGTEDMTGYTKEEIENTNFENIFFDKKNERISFKNAISYSLTPNNEWLCRKKNGEYLTVLINIVPQYSVGHKLIGYIFSAVDITTRKNAELELEHQIRFLQTLVDSMPIAVYYKDEHFRIIGCNKAFEDIMEMPKDEMIGKTSEYVYFDKVSAEVSMNTDEQIRKNISTISYERVVKFRKSGLRNLAFYTSAYQKIGGGFGGIIGVMIDVTKERQMQQERDNLQTSLIQQNKLASLGELAGSIAHEMNNPLSIILGFAQVLRKDSSLGEEARKGVENIFEAANRSKSIITNMLEFARADSSNLHIVDLNDVIESTLQIVEKDFSKAGIEIKKELSADNKAVSVNPMQAQQVLLNMILNAKDAMPGGGTLTVESAVKGKMFVINISDTGIGIPREHLSKIFDPFFTTKDVGKGTGLGLSICYGIVNSHKGDIFVKSVLGKGSTFTIKFPLISQE